MGGARSGKSQRALDAAQQSGLRLHFIATAEARDDEMQRRIKQHQQERDERWSLTEEPIDLASTLKQFSAGDCVVIDCLTLWLSNCLCSKDETCWETEKTKFVAAVKVCPAKLIMVSNETGLGVVPANKLSRQFVDESGWLHQQLAQISDRVTIMFCGLPHILKDVNNDN